MRRVLLPLTFAGLAVVGLARIRDLQSTIAPDVVAGWARPGAGVVFGPRRAPTGGEVTVGLFVPTPPSPRLVDRVAPGTWETFLREEAALGDAERVPVVAEVPAWEEVEARNRWDALLAKTQRRRSVLVAAAASVADQTNVRVSFRDVLAADAVGLAMVLVEGRIEHGEDLERLVALRAAGTRVLCTDEAPPGLGERCPALLPGDPHAVGPLVDAVVDMIRTSPLLDRRAEDPLEVVEARRDGADVVVRLREVPASASLRDLADREVAVLTSAADGTLRVRCPDPLLDPHAHRVVVRTIVGGLPYARAWTVAQLVGFLDRRVLAADVAEAGAPFAPRVVFSGSKAGVPVAGVGERLALVIGDRTVAEARGVTDALGLLDARLSVPEDAPVGPAFLVVGADRFPLTVRTGVRVSVVTDRALYRPTDEAHVRVLVHRATSGRPVADAEVVLRLADAEQRVRTSTAGVASTTFHLVEQRPGPIAVTATVAGASASAPLRVRAFETPSFTVVCEPSELRMRAGELVSLVVVSRYVNGSPVVGAKVHAWSEEEGPRPEPSEALTDGEGRVVFAVASRADGAGHRLKIRVADADGRAVERTVDVEGSAPPPTLALEPLDEPVVGRPGRLEIRGEGPGLVMVTVPQEAPRAVELGPDGRGTLSWTPAAASLVVGVQAPGRPRVDRVMTVADLGSAERLLVLPSRRVATVGDTLEVELSGPDGVAFVELARDGTVLRTRLVAVEHGRGRLSLPLDPDLAGVLALRAGRDDAEAIAGSESTVLVARGRSLRVTARPTASTWRPGETASVDVEVADRAGRPTAAVLGYWGVDEALLALAPWADGREDAFDAMPVRPTDDVARVAASLERGSAVRFASAREALGALRALDRLPPEFRVTHRTGPAREAAARRATIERFRASLAACRGAVVEALRTIPPREIRVTGSLLAMLKGLVRERRLDPSMLVDPWGSPFVIGRGLEPQVSCEAVGSEGEWRSWATGVPWRCAGPDLALGTSDDLIAAWKPIAPAEIGGPLGRWLAQALGDELGPPSNDGLVAEVAPAAYDEEFEGPANNGLIGLGGGAGVAFGGRGFGGHRSLVGGGAGRAEEPPLHVRRDFAPTLCFVPEAIVGGDGKARVELGLGDAITTWRLRLVASAADGATGIGETRVLVSQPLHVDPWVAGRLTVGDDIEVPVAVRNETEEPVTPRVRLSVSQELAVVGPAEASAEVPARGTGALVFRVRAVGPGTAHVRFDAETATERDAVERMVVVRRDARAVIDMAYGTLRAGSAFAAVFPAAPAPGPEEHRVTFYASPLADVLGGFEGLIACPHG